MLDGALRRVPQRSVVLAALVVLAACEPGSPTPTDSGGSGPSARISSSSSPAAASPRATHTPQPPGPIPGLLLITDRGNDRMLLVDGRKHIIWQYPQPGRTPQLPFVFDDDAFFTPGYRSVVSNQEEQQTIQIVSFPWGRVLWHYGHVNVRGSAPGYLSTPDDAYVLPNGTVVVADVRNCRILEIARDHTVARQLGTTGVCAHAPPRLLASPNGDTPHGDGSLLVTEISGSWVDAIGPSSALRWSVHAPVAYPSDAQWLGHGRILLADYSSPGHVLEMDRRGKVLWEYGPSSGLGELDHPSLAIRLPNGLIAVNDDYHDRVVLIDPKAGRIVWQYGHLNMPGRAPGYLNTPDGMDFLPWAVAMRVPAVRALVLRRG